MPNGATSSADAVEDFETLYIFGAGGHGRELAWLAQEIWGGSRRIAFLVDDPAYLRASVNGIPVRLLDDMAFDATSRYVVAIGDPRERRRLDTEMKARHARATTLVHPRAECSTTVTLGPGAVLAAGVVATTNVALGQHVHVNVGSTLAHDVTIGEFTSVSPGVHIAGHVNIGPDCFIGVGASIINGTEAAPLAIGAGATVAAGACVVRPVAPGTLVAGVPGRPKSRPFAHDPEGSDR